MTDRRSPLDEHTEVFGRELANSRGQLERAGRRRRRATAIGVPLVAAVSLAVAFSPGEEVSVLDRAEAALSPQTGVVHYRTRTTTNGQVDRRCDAPPVDVWQETAARPKWRFRQGTSPCGTMVTGLGHVQTGPGEQSFDGRDLVSTAPKDGWVERLTNAHGAATRIPNIVGLGERFGRDGSTDPVSFLTGLLTSGALQVVGRRTVAGRDAFLLSGIDRGARVRYRIDAKTFAPLEIEHELKLPNNMGPGMRRAVGTTLRVQIETYGPATSDDLAPDMPANPTTTTVEYDAWLQELRAGQDREVAPVEARRAKARLKALGRPWR